MLIRKTLKQIPDDLLVLDKDTANDERICFLIEKYNDFIENGEDLSPISEEMTFGDYKEELNKVNPDLLIDFLSEYRNKYLGGDKGYKREKRNPVKVILYLLTFLLIIVVLSSLILGLLNKDLDSTSILNTFIDFFGKVFNALIGSPEPPPF